MIDLHQPDEPMESFLTIEAYRKSSFCKTADIVPIQHRAVPRYESIPTDNKLWDIYKRTTDLSVNKCVGIGFEYDDAQRFITKRLKIEINNQTDVVTFYDIVPQNVPEAKDPLWNSGEIIIGKNEY